jgi:hypothetical protein
VFGRPAFVIRGLVKYWSSSITILKLLLVSPAQLNPHAPPHPNVSAKLQLIFTNRVWIIAPPFGWVIVTPVGNTGDLLLQHAAVFVSPQDKPLKHVPGQHGPLQMHVCVTTSKFPQVEGQPSVVC